MFKIDISVLQREDWQNHVAYVDFETQSAVDLRNVGSVRYIANPTTRIMSAVIMTNREVIVWLPNCPYRKQIKPLAGVRIVDEFPAVAIRNKVLVGHNAEMFDAILLDTKILGNYTWVDTIHLCRLAGLPAGLGDALQAIGRPGKLSSKAMKILTEAKVDRYGNPVYMQGTPPLWEKLIAYNIQDVTELEVLLKWLVFNLEITELERNNVSTQAEINSRGFTIDRDYTNHLRNLWDEMQNKAKDEVEVITGGALKYHRETGKHDIASPQRVKAYLTGLGFTLPGDSLNQQTVNQILLNPERYTDGMDDTDGKSIIALLALRQNACRATVGKLDRILKDTGADGLVNYWSNYHGAHTGRNTGRGINPLNFPRGVKLADASSLLAKRNSLTYDDIVESSISNKLSQSDVLGALTRSIIVPRKGKVFAVCDYMQIEARVLALLAGCGKLLHAFSNPDIDVYCQMASMQFGRMITPEDKDERFIGKTTVLGCGYQMGAEKCEVMMRNYNVDLRSVGLTGKDCVTAYRKGYPEIPKLWEATNTAAIDCVKFPGKVYTACMSEFVYESGFMKIKIPSGRILRYRNPIVEKTLTPWGTNVDAVKYQTGYGFYKNLYGGILVENIDQATSRDIMAESLTYPAEDEIPVLHVYDEIVYEIPDKRIGNRLAGIARRMSRPPVWLPDLPLGVEGHTGKFYAKSGENTVAYLAGKPIRH